MEGDSPAEEDLPAGVKDPRALREGKPLAPCLAECAGTFLIVFFGLGAVHAAVLTGAQSGLFQVAVVWGIGVALGIHATAAVSGAHLNPAMTAAFAAVGSFPLRRVPVYWLSQTLGAFLAAALLHEFFAPVLKALEAERGVARGSPGSEAFAMCYGEYFPNPAAAAGLPALSRIGEGTAFLVEAASTAVLAFVIFALSEPRNARSPGPRLAPAWIGLAVAGLISVIAPLTQACLNPARDFGPRLFAWMAGWGTIAIPGPRGGFFTVYILAPILGAVAGALLYRMLLRRTYPSQEGGS